MSPAEARRELAQMIRTTGLSSASFARLVLARNPRTLERWLAGDSPISPVVRRWLATVRVRRTARLVCVLIRVDPPDIGKA